MNVAGLDKARILMALWNRAYAPGLGAMISAVQKPMTIEKAQEILKPFNASEFHVDDTFSNSPQQEPIYFDYLMGRVMKINIAPDWLDTRLYNRDNGHEAAELAILDEFTKP